MKKIITIIFIFISFFAVSQDSLTNDTIAVYKCTSLAQCQALNKEINYTLSVRYGVVPNPNDNYNDILYTENFLGVKSYVLPLGLYSLVYSAHNIAMLDTIQYSNNFKAIQRCRETKFYNDAINFLVLEYVALRYSLRKSDVAKNDYQKYIE